MTKNMHSKLKLASPKSDMHMLTYDDGRIIDHRIHIEQ